MNGKLRKISDNKNALRTATVEGVFDELPEVGYSFRLISKSLTDGSLSRIVTTSVVKYLNPVNMGDNKTVVLRFETLNSLYELVVDRIELEEGLMNGRHS